MSASGSTATVQAEVWMRPCASVFGTRCTRWPPDSNLSRENAPWPAMRAMTFLLPPSSEALSEMISTCQPLALGIARVHAEKVAREAGFITAGAGAHLDEEIALVVRVLRQGAGLVPFEPLHRRARFLQLLVVGLHRRVGRHLARLGRIALHLGSSGKERPARTFGVLAREPLELLQVASRSRRRAGRRARRAARPCRRAWCASGFTSSG